MAQLIRLSRRVLEVIQGLDYIWAQSNSHQVTEAISCSCSPPKLLLRCDHEQVTLVWSAKGGTELGPVGFLPREGLLGGNLEVSTRPELTRPSRCLVASASTST